RRNNRLRPIIRFWRYRDDWLGRVLRLALLRRRRLCSSSIQWRQILSCVVVHDVGLMKYVSLHDLRGLRPKLGGKTRPSKHDGDQREVSRRRLQETAPRQRRGDKD